MHVIKPFITVLALLCYGTSILAQDIASSLYPYIYTNLNNYPCVRLLHANGTVGCHAPHTASGILYEIETQDDIDQFPPFQGDSRSYAVFLPYYLLTKTNIQKLEASQRITGIIAWLSSENNVSVISPDAMCPNCEYGLYANEPNQYMWNPQGDGLLQEHFNFPIFAIKPENALTKKVYQYFTRALNYNKEKQYQHYPLQAVDFDLFMWAAVNSGTCLRRGWCQAIGGLSVYSTPSLEMNAQDDKPILMLTAAMDSRSMFQDLTVGVEDDVSGLVALLAVAETLSRAPKALDTLGKHIMYTAFTAESWGFAGSQRFVKDISTPFQCTNATRATPCPFTNAPCTFPCIRSDKFTRINMEKIDSIIEFKSVTGRTSNYSGGYWAHVDDIDTSKGLVDALAQQTRLTGSELRNAYADTQRKLPPSSIMSFLDKKRTIPATVVTDYQKEFGRYYHSDMDYLLNLEPMTQSICKLVNATARTTFIQAQGSSDGADLINANCTVVQSLLDCLSTNFSCPFMQDYFNVSKIGSISHYTSVYSFEDPMPQLVPRFVFSYLSGVTGTPRKDSQGQVVSCHQIQDCNPGEYCIKQKCVKTFTEYHPAYGTGLHYDEAEGKLGVVDPTKGTWTESTWNTPKLRIFLVTSEKHQIVELVIGLLWTLTSIAAVLLAHRYLKTAAKG
ncbi:Nicastrin-domain-containing protein [Radiomyces spectabilis]|uniref:Nicastrin-domain-containing protein n=1 Tax=Radiomyces spectabilis TaxID=64574 RepID=UPI00221ED50C|nr:Nicastrin-domain-containing protein [Radiomyces spectabilis]KAI8391220.1 Nicastrin-domain-containing protein [Radiomyces spectabilis]